MKMIILFITMMAFTIAKSCNSIFEFQRSRNMINCGDFEFTHPFWKTFPYYNNRTCNKYQDYCFDISKDKLIGPLVGDNYILFTSEAYPKDEWMTKNWLSQYVQINEDAFDLELTFYVNIHR